MIPIRIQTHKLDFFGHIPTICLYRSWIMHWLSVVADRNVAFVSKNSLQSKFKITYYHLDSWSHEQYIPYINLAVRQKGHFNICNSTVMPFVPKKQCHECLATGAKHVSNTAQHMQFWLLYGLVNSDEENVILIDRHVALVSI